MVVARAFLAASEHFSISAGAIRCTTLNELDRVHRAAASHDVAIPLGLVPAMQWSMLTFTFGRYRIASDAIHAIAVLRATDMVQIAERPIDRHALLARHPRLRPLEACLVETIVERIGDPAATRWSDDCSAAIAAWHRRRATLRGNKMAHPEGFEPPTKEVEAPCSIQLSYGCPPPR